MLLIIKVMNEIISGLSSLINSAVILLNDNGTVESIINKEKVQPSSLIGLIENDNNVFSLFDLPNASTLTEAIKTRHGFYIKENPHYYELLHDFIINLPMITLKVIPAENGKFIGLVQSVDVLPVLPFADSFLAFYADKSTGTIIGLNRQFASLFGIPLENAKSLLDKPISDYLDPSPFDLKRQYSKRASDMSFHFEPRYQIADEEIISLMGISDTTNKNLRMPITLENNNNDNSILTIPVNINSGTDDFRVTIDITVQNKSAPLFLWGYEEHKLFHPDNMYMAGPDGSLERPIIKKKGFTLEQGEKWQTLPDGIWRFEKRGKLLSLNCSSISEVSFHDFQLSQAEHSFISLSLRSGSSVKVNKITFEIFPTIDESSQPGEDLQIRLKSPTPRNAIISHLPNHSMGAKWPFCMGFVLTDVTTIETRAEKFKSQYLKARVLGEELTEMLAGKLESSSTFIGESPQIKALKEKIDLIASSKAPVMIEGETGCGKEVLARAIHEKSSRADQVFVKIDCSVFSNELLESELFGHEKGAFTGALQKKIGRFEQAHKGTLFLDEIANLSMSVQAKLLGVLQDHVIHRVGGTSPIALDIRIIAATNIPLSDLLATGKFREDLYYRISTVTLFLPSLSERIEDIPLLCSHFLEQLGASKRGINGLTGNAYSKLYSHNWPGNIRELRNVLHRAILFCTDDRIDAHDIQFDLLNEKGITAPMKKKRAALTKARLIEALQMCKGNVRSAAKMVKVSRKTCYEAFVKFNISPDAYRKSSL
ncbi:MAG: sigma-54-dependent Fis family transcriptional regulator [Fibrobacteres bacterium]|nr:sigma-54-dependent Fis family transcriptional regulator [Fibrobacterota bacterium]